MKKLGNIIILPLIFIIAMGMVACQSKDETSTAPNTANEEVLLKVAGSTSVSPLIMELKFAYEEKHNNVSIEVQQTGSSAGVTATLEGSADIGMSSRDLKPEELEQGLEEYIIAIDGMAVILNNDNPVQNLTTEQITAIYKGEITNWKEVGGNDAEIVVVSREEGSGTRSSFETLLNLEEDVTRNGKKLKKSLVTENALFENSAGAVKTDVMSNDDAIGYISYGTLDDSIKAVNVNGIAVNEENILNDSYEIKRPFVICTLGEPSADEKQFIDFIFSEEGQNIVSEENYVRVK